VTRCQLCQEPGRAWCRDTIGCNFRARLRLGIPVWRAKQLRAAELVQRRELAQGRTA
jgi:hypothetical protein